MKRIVCILVTVALLLSLFSCSEYRPGQGGITNGGGNKKPSGSGNQGGLDGDPNNDFAVELWADDQPYVPRVSISAYWNDGYSIHSAEFDKTGRATIDGLDGDYRVSLSAVPYGYAYDPNAYVATNDNRVVIIKMYSLNMLIGSGDDLYGCYEIDKTGVYTVSIDGPDDKSYVEFIPRTNGVYTIESWVSTVDDQTSPVCLAYLGHSQNKYGEYRVTDEGLCGSFTRNFIHTVNIADMNISDGGGSQTFTFAIGADTKSGNYPVNVTFAIKRNGDFDPPEGVEKVTVYPSFDWSGFDSAAFDALAGGELVGAESLYPGSTDTYVFDEDNFRICPDDGIYHLYDEEKYSATGGYGPMLVAYVTAPCRYFSEDEKGNKASFVTIEDAGNNALVIDGKYNYRMFIKGTKMLADAGNYCHKDCLCHPDGGIRVCPADCMFCHKDCTPCPPEDMAVVGYADRVNADGVAPVTAELKDFLQAYVSSSFYFFADGEGSIEEDYGINSDEDSQWLFACGYYK